MWMRMVYLILLVLGVSMGYSQTNYIKNGGFEQWDGLVPAEWTIRTDGITVSRDTLEVSEGESAARIKLTSKDTQILDQDSIPVIGGNRYRISMRIRDNDAAGKLRFWGYWDGHDVSGGPQYNTYSDDSEDWQLYEFEVEAPPGAISMKLEIRFYDVSSKWDGDAEFIVDDVSVIPVAGLRPAIFNVTDSVFIADQPIQVSAHIRDDQEVSSAILFYSKNGSSTAEEVVLEEHGGDVWTAWIPACTARERLDYWIYAEDDESHTVFSDTFKVLVGKAPLEMTHITDENGVVMYRGYKIHTSGVVTVSSGIFSEKSQDVFIQDHNSGINLFSDDKRSIDLTEQDSVEVVGRIDQLNGRSILVPEDIIVLGQAIHPPEAEQIVCEQVGEAQEGKLVEIQNVSVSGWVEKPDTSFFAMLSDGGASLKLEIREGTDIDGHPNPAGNGTITIKGIVSQNDSDPPFAEEYVIIPRSWSDLAVTSIHEQNPVLSFFHLEPNYPNPFNPVTTIRYQIAGFHSAATQNIASPQNVELTVHNILGQKIATLVSEKQAAGHYTVKWNGSEYVSGIYFYCLNVDGKTVGTRKMVLMK